MQYYCFGLNLIHYQLSKMKTLTALTLVILFVLISCNASQNLTDVKSRPDTFDFQYKLMPHSVYSLSKTEDIKSMMKTEGEPVTELEDLIGKPSHIKSGEFQTMKTKTDENSVIRIEMTEDSIYHTFDDPFLNGVKSLPEIKSKLEGMKCMAHSDDGKQILLDSIVTDTGATNDKIDYDDFSCWAFQKYLPAGKMSIGDTFYFIPLPVEALSKKDLSEMTESQITIDQERIENRRRYMKSAKPYFILKSVDNGVAVFEYKGVKSIDQTKHKTTDGMLYQEISTSSKGNAKYLLNHSYFKHFEIISTEVTTYSSKKFKIRKTETTSTAHKIDQVDMDKRR